MVGCATGSDESTAAPDAAIADTSVADTGAPVVDSATSETAVTDAVVTSNHAHEGSELVGGGAITSSSTYRMIGTLGPSSPQSVVMKSSSYQMFGGVVAATGGK